MSTDAVLNVEPLQFPWQTSDPFLFCVHHDDTYPAGNEKLGPDASLAGRQIGQDFEGKDGWRMYHGDTVPGFPQHPHRGFETVTVMRHGFIDHSDSLGATARFGPGDVQWLTAGGGIVHSEMFPLLDDDGPNPLELFQIWLNLPPEDKLVEPHFSMLWEDSIPVKTVLDAQGRRTEVTVVAGQLGEVRAPPPPPNSWASRSDTEVAIWTIRMASDARFTIPAAAPGLNRSVYFFGGSRLSIEGRPIGLSSVVRLRSDTDTTLENGPDEADLLLLQGRPIGAPVAQYGPFVMNSPDEIQQAFDDYRRTEYGGWPWPTNDPVLPRLEGRYARHADGHEERAKPPKQPSTK
jgi:redox-sensitive bicupin YhaK (pirin superfamily)